MGSLTLLRNSDFMQSERPGRIFQRREAALWGRGRLAGGSGGGGRLGGHVCVGGGAFVSGAPRCVPVITFDSLPPAYY